MYKAAANRYETMQYFRCGQSLAQMALAWILRDGVVTSVLAGASKPEQLLDNLKALENTSFTDEELQKIDRIYGTAAYLDTPERDHTPYLCCTRLLPSV